MVGWHRLNNASACKGSAAGILWNMLGKATELLERR